MKPKAHNPLHKATKPSPEPQPKMPECSFATRVAIQSKPKPREAPRLLVEWRGLHLGLAVPQPAPEAAGSVFLSLRGGWSGPADHSPIRPA